MRSRRHSIAEARNHLHELVRHAAEEGKAVELTRRGAPVAVLVRRSEYGRLTAPARTFREAWEVFSRGGDLKQANIDPDEIFGGIREDNPGRV